MYNYVTLYKSLLVSTLYLYSSIILRYSFMVYLNLFYFYLYFLVVTFLILVQFVV